METLLKFPFLPLPQLLKGSFRLLVENSDSLADDYVFYLRLSLFVEIEFKS